MGPEYVHVPILESFKFGHNWSWVVFVPIFVKGFDPVYSMERNGIAYLHFCF